MNAQHTPGPLPESITRAITELREAEFKSGMHRRANLSVDAERWAEILKREIRAAIAKATGEAP